MGKKVEEEVRRGEKKEKEGERKDSTVPSWMPLTHPIHSANACQN